ncbi:hypothetical protein, conserved [Eimeria maxima]|uniref:Polynucleotide adenylyltransferase n=1 Tax=Eimeria maxima TaxID=5804 RepID=U6M506_EIMMA|nr:hypothetical protein, conserved [Eimeria maxima]CDJ57514.1 hypothetical protein, conserved [Eimeria maxima]
MSIKGDGRDRTQEETPKGAAAAAGAKETVNESPLYKETKEADSKELLHKRTNSSKETVSSSSSSKLLLLPPKSYDASARALCYFLDPLIRPYNPWLNKQQQIKGDSTAAAAAAGDSIPPQETMEQPQLSPVCSSNSSNSSNSSSSSIALELKALDEELRPSLKGDRQRRSLVRLLGKRIRRQSWYKELRGETGEGDKEKGDTLIRTGDNKKGPPPPPPLLLPYGSSFTGLGDWAADIDLLLLLPSSCRTAAAATAAAAAPTAAAAAAETKGTPKELLYNQQVSPFPYCLLCRVYKETNCLHGFLPRTDAATILTRLNCLLNKEKELDGLFCCMQLIVPPVAPPLLRGVYRHPRDTAAAAAAAAAASTSSKASNKEVSPNGQVSPLHCFLSPKCLLSCKETVDDEQGDKEEQQEETGDRQERGHFVAAADAVAAAADAAAAAEDTEKGDTRDTPSIPIIARTWQVSPYDGSIVSPLLSPSSVSSIGDRGDRGDTRRHSEGIESPLNNNIIYKRRHFTPVPFDITTGCLLGPLNSLLLKEYANNCLLFPPLVRIIKHWADCRGLTGTRDGCLSSYAWVLLVVFFLQSVSPPLLPKLQQQQQPLQQQEQEQEEPKKEQEQQQQQQQQQQEQQQEQQPQGPSASLLETASPHSPFPGERRHLRRHVEGDSLLLSPSVSFPIEIVGGRHSIWFLKKGDTYLWGPRVLSLLQSVLRGATQQQLLLWLQHYVPGYLFLPSKETQETQKGDTKQIRPIQQQQGDNVGSMHALSMLQQVAGAVSLDTPEGDSQGRPLVSPLTHGKECLLSGSRDRSPMGSGSTPGSGSGSALGSGSGSGDRSQQRSRRSAGSWVSPLTEKDWETIASLLHAFFVFFGYYFNSFSLLVSIKGDNNVPKYLLSGERHKKGGRKKEETQKETPTETPAVSAVSPGHVLPPRRGDRQQHCSSSAAGTADAAAATDAAAAAAAAGTAKETAQRLRKEAIELEETPTSSYTPKEKKTIDELLIALEEQQEISFTKQSVSFGITIEDPIEVGRHHTYRRPQGSELFYYEMQRAERLLREG